MNCKFIDIKKIYNNKLFVCSNENYCKENGNVVGEFFDANSLLKYCDIEFDLKNIYTGEYDSLTCEGQVIEINPENYNCLVILATAFWDNYHEKIQILNEKTKLPFDVSNSQNIGNQFTYDVYNSEIAFSCNELTKRYSRYIYMHFFSIESGKAVSLELPYNPSIVVCALTLIRN